MSRAAVLMSGVTLGSLVALLLGSGMRKRRVATAMCFPRLPRFVKIPSRPTLPEPPREDVLERYRLAAAV